MIRKYKKKINNAQMIKGNQTSDNDILLGFFVTYQCGEVVQVGFSLRMVHKKNRRQG